MSSIFPFKSIENEHDVYNGKDSTKKFCEFKRASNEDNIFQKKKMKLLANEQQKSFGIFDPARKKRRKVRKLLHKD